MKVSNFLSLLLLTLCQKGGRETGGTEAGFGEFSNLGEREGPNYLFATRLRPDMDFLVTLLWPFSGFRWKRPNVGENFFKGGTASFLYGARVSLGALGPIAIVTSDSQEKFCKHFRGICDIFLPAVAV